MLKKEKYKDGKFAEYLNANRTEILKEKKNNKVRLIGGKSASIAYLEILLINLI